MNRYLRCCLLLWVYSTAIFAASGTYWQCTLRDASNNIWQSQNPYKKMAMMQSLDACKKNSNNPLSCKASYSNCEYFIQGISVSPMWQCIALDHTATAWPSDLYPGRFDAALAAKDFCKQRSVFPETCYVNFVTCTNKNELR